jgi:hypothetical protein
MGKRAREPKVLTFEEKKKQAWDSYTVIPKYNSIGEPTYAYKIGEKVKIGCLKNCVVDEITEYDGVTLYGVKYTNENDECYIYTPWYSVRPYEMNGVTNFSKEDAIKIYFYNTTIESLLNKFYLSGVDMNPPYQRDYVWSEKDKESLLDSIFNHIEIGKFAFIYRDYSNNIGFEILDGKQRLSTLLDFYENRLPYKGVYYNELSFQDRYTFLNATVAIGEANNLSIEQIYKYFYTLNKCGKTMSEEHLEKIKENIDEMMEESKDEDEMEL